MPRLGGRSKTASLQRFAFCLALAFAQARQQTQQTSWKTEIRMTRRASTARRKAAVNSALRQRQYVKDGRLHWLQERVGLGAGPL